MRELASSHNLDETTKELEKQISALQSEVESLRHENQLLKENREQKIKDRACQDDQRTS